MTGIVFKAAFGDKDKTVTLSRASGSNGSYHIMIDKYYWGMMVKTSKGWRVYFNNPEYFTSADADVLIEMVENV